MDKELIVSRSKNARLWVTYDFYCYASKGAFVDWEDMSEKWKAEFAVNGPIPCENSGDVGSWCADCRYGEEVYIDEGE